MADRICTIMTGNVGMHEDAADDGVEDLYRVPPGSPDEIGKAIAECLKTVDLLGGRNLTAAVAERGQEIFVEILVKIAPKPAEPEPARMSRHEVQLRNELERVRMLLKFVKDGVDVAAVLRTEVLPGIETVLAQTEES